MQETREGQHDDGHGRIAALFNDPQLNPRP
jgi:hypothetical protein